MKEEILLKELQKALRKAIEIELATDTSTFPIRDILYDLIEGILLNTQEEEE